MKQHWTVPILVIAFIVRCASWPCTAEVSNGGDGACRSLIADIAIVAIPGDATTADEHRALARAYEEKATSYRANVTTYRRNAYADEQRIPVIPKNVNDDPRIKKIRENRDQLIERAQRLARAAELLALFHAMRATEMAGK